MIYLTSSCQLVLLFFTWQPVNRPSKNHCVCHFYFSACFKQKLWWMWWRASFIVLNKNPNNSMFSHYFCEEMKISLEPWWPLGEVRGTELFFSPHGAMNSQYNQMTFCTILHVIFQGNNDIRINSNFRNQSLSQMLPVGEAMIFIPKRIFLFIFFPKLGIHRKLTLNAYQRFVKA